MADYLGKKIKFNIEDNDLQKIRFNKVYGESTQETRSGKNLLKNTATTKTNNGINFTVNDDKTILVDGTNDGTANSSFIINNYSLEAGTYILNGCPSGGSSTTYRLAIQNTSGWSVLGLDTGSGSEQFTIDEATNVQVAIFISKGQTVSNLIFKPMIRLSSIIDDSYEEYGVMPSPDYPSEIENIEGNIEFKVDGKNIFDCANSKIIYNNGNTLYERLTNGLKIISSGGQYNMLYFLVDTVENLKGKTLTLSSDILFSKENQLTTLGLFYTDTNGGNRTTLITNNNITSKGKYQVAGQVSEGENRYYVCIGLRPNTASNYASGDYTIYDNLQVEYDETATDYEPYKSQVATFTLGEGQKLMEGSYLADDGIHHTRKQRIIEITKIITLTNGNIGGVFNISDKIKENNNGLICSNTIFDKKRTFTEGTVYENEDNAVFVGNSIDTLETIKAKYDGGILEYELAEEEIVPYTETQQEAWEKLRHFKGLNGENNITAQGTMTSTLDLTLYNVAEEDFDIYISKKGYFGALKYDINNLIDFTESNIPSIAEATESSVKIAGRDGDMPLNTVYEPLSFEIVCYTEDNLTPEEKIIEEQKITSLLNSIKNQTKTFFMEREKKFYKVKYSGNLSVVRYPKHLKFTIPLKSSESYAMNCEESEIIGNGIKISNTIKETGAIFTIKGPAIKPIISLNNYQMKYNENILEGNSLIINSEDSTITHITSAGVKTNAMRAYNHEFPKIKNGENQLAVSSGIDDENQVNVKWYDLKI